MKHRRENVLDAPPLDSQDVANEDPVFLRQVFVVLVELTIFSSFVRPHALPLHHPLDIEEPGGSRILPEPLTPEGVFRPPKVIMLAGGYSL